MDKKKPSTPVVNTRNSCLAASRQGSPSAIGNRGKGKQGKSQRQSKQVGASSGPGQDSGCRYPGENLPEGGTGSPKAKGRQGRGSQGCEPGQSSRRWPSRDRVTATWRQQ